MNITEFWNSNNEQQWKGKLNNYWSFVKPENFKLEKKMNGLDSNKIKVMSANEFYKFLDEEYFVWKYTVNAATYCPAIDGVSCPEFDGITGQGTPSLC